MACGATSTGGRGAGERAHQEEWCSPDTTRGSGPETKSTRVAGWQARFEHAFADAETVPLESGRRQRETAAEAWPLGAELASGPTGRESKPREWGQRT